MPIDALPKAVRILPNRLALRLGLGAGLTLCSALMIEGPPTGGRDAALALIGYWSAFAVGALAAIGYAVGLVVQLPVIEASELGLAVWLEGPYRRPFFAPWSRVRSIMLTRMGPAGGSGARDALAIELDPEDRLRLPAAARSRAAGAAPADLCWSRRAISGDPRRWVELLGRMKAAYAEEAAGTEPDAAATVATAAPASASRM
jgi:hypothetical protein